MAIPVNGIIVIKSTSIRLLLWQSVVKSVVKSVACIWMAFINMITTEVVVERAT